MFISSSVIGGALDKDLIDGFIWYWMVRVIVVLALVFALGYCVASHADMITACTHPASPPTFTGSEKEQELAALKYHDKEASRDALCDTLPPLKYLPYAWQHTYGDWNIRLYLFLRIPHETLR